MANKISIQFVAKGHTGVTQAVKALNKQVEKLAAANMFLQKNTDKLSMSQEQLVGKLLNTQRNLRNTGKTAATTGATFSVLRSKMLLASFGASLVSGSLLKLTNMAGDADEQMAKASVVFGDSFQSMSYWTDDFGNRVNRSRFDLMQMAASVQDILVPMGLMRNEAAKLSKGVVELAVDVGSFSNVTSANVMRDFNSALVGNHETVRKYGIVISEARMKQVALDEGIISSGETLTDQQKILARLALLQKDSTDAIGDAERTSQSYANVMQGLAAQTEETAVIIGQFLLPTVKVLAQTFTVLMKALAKPTVWITLAVAIGIYTKNAIKARLATARLTARFRLARKQTRLFRISMIKLVPLFLALEAAFFIFEKLQIPKPTLDSITDAGERLKTLNNIIKDLSQENIQVRMDIDKASLDIQETALTKLKKEAEDIKLDIYMAEDLPDLSAQLKIKELNTALGKVNNKIDVSKSQIKKYQENIAEYEKSLKNANGTTEAFAKTQVKLADALEKAKIQFSITTQIMDKHFNIAAKNAIAMKMFGKTYADVKDTSKEAAKDIDALVKVQAENIGINKRLDLKTQNKNLLENSKAQQFINTQLAKGIELKDADIKKIKELFAEQRKIKFDQQLKSLEQRSSFMQKELDLGRELTEMEKFRIELLHTKSNLNADEIEQYEEILKKIDAINQAQGQATVNRLEGEIADIKNPQASPQQQFGADLMSGMPMFGSSGEGIFGLTLFKKQESAFANYISNTKKAYESFVSDNTSARNKLITEIESLDSTEVTLKAEKLEKLKELELEYAEFEKDNEDKKSTVRGEALQMAQETFNNFIAQKQQALQQDMNNELTQLKSSDRFKRASDKRKEKMEAEVRKKYAKEQVKLFRMEQMSQVANIAMSTGTAIMKAVSAFPLRGGMPWSAIIGAMGAAQVGMVLSQKPPQYRYGGLIGGMPHNMGGTLIEAERGEFVMNRQASDSIGLEQLNRMNRTGSAGNNINITLSGNVLSDDFVADEFIPKLEERIKVLSDGTISDRFA